MEVLRPLRISNAAKPFSNAAESNKKKTPENLKSSLHPPLLKLQIAKSHDSRPFLLYFPTFT